MYFISQYYTHNLIPYLRQYKNLVPKPKLETTDIKLEAYVEGLKLILP